MADRGRTRRGNDRDAYRVQNTRVRGVSRQSESDVHNAGGIRRRVLNAGPFILHNAHIRRGTGKDAGCPVCTAKVGDALGVVEITVPGSDLGEGSGIDGTEAASSSLDSMLQKVFASDVSEES